MQPQSETGAVGGELRSGAKQVAGTAVNRLHNELDARKGTAATQVRSVSSAIDQTVSGLDQNAPAWLRSALQQGAQQVQRFADTLEQKDSRQIVDEVSQFARNSPGTFLAACAAAGFAASRLFRAGAEGSSGLPSSQSAGGSSSQGSSDYQSSETQRSAPASTEYRSSFETTYGQPSAQSGSPSSRGEFA